MNLISDYLVKKILAICNIVCVSLLLYSCSANKEWQDATIIYADNFEKSALILAKRSTYFTFIKSKSSEGDSKKEILIPEEVRYVDSKDGGYISMYFDEENYGMESWSFGKVLAGDSVKLVETRFQFKTCACKTAGKFFHGYFLVNGINHLKIKTDNKNNIYNRSEIYEFVDKYSEYPLPMDINNIVDLTFSLQNINN
jgi:hypothetical protein